MQLDTVQILKDSKQLIESGWCKNHYAQDAAGYPVELLTNEVTTVCVAGAVYTTVAKAMGLKTMNGGEMLEDSATDILHIMRNVLNKGKSEDDTVLAMSTWNDHPSRTKEEVLEIFDKTIASLEK